MGSRAEPSGTPESTLIVSEVSPSRITDWFLPSRNACIQRLVFLLNFDAVVVQLVEKPYSPLIYLFVFFLLLFVRFELCCVVYRLAVTLIVNISPSQTGYMETRYLSAMAAPCLKSS